MLLAGDVVRAQITGDVIGTHDLGPGSKSPIVGTRPDFCLYCHAPHSGLGGLPPLWNQTLSTQSYQTYTSTTETNTGAQPVLGAESSLCLSCHDGTVAPGQTVVFGQVTMTGSMYASDKFGTNLQSSHPFSLALPLKDSIDLVESLVSQGKTGDPTGAVKLVSGNVECTSCHNPHVEAKDQIARNFLVRDSSSGQMCLACHDPKRTISGQVNPLAGWFESIHATSSAVVQNLPYATLSQNACFSCHTDHDAAGPVWLQRGAGDQVCLNCHSGDAPVTNNVSHTKAAFPSMRIPPALAARINIAAEYAKIGHPTSSTIDSGVAGLQAKIPARKQSAGEVVNTPQQSGCVDCHDPHAVQATQMFPAAPGVRPAQKGERGISATDGVTVVTPAVDQYQGCLRCHGRSAGKTVYQLFGYSPTRAVSAGDPLNLIPQFSINYKSSHPVMHDRTSLLQQPSLLNNMRKLDGTTPGRLIGNRIFCTDCHNSDDNREVGGNGPNGPHGSKWPHILERRYEFSQATLPGQLITNLFPNPDLSSNGPYALCAKCHDLPNQIIKDTSFKHHAEHINAGLSCSTCHTAHGMGASNGNVSGERLVNFDINVVGPNGSNPISYNWGRNTCTLTCHGVVHNIDGSVSGRSSPNKVPIHLKN